MTLRDIREIIKVARPGFWPTQLWFFLLPMAGKDLFDSFAFWIGCVYVCLPLGLLLYGWNDLGDSVADQHNARKDSWLFGGRPNSDLRKKLPWVILAVQIPFVISFVNIAGPKMLFWFLAVLISNATYNNLGWKRWPVLDLLNQIGYLLIFVLARWLCNLETLGIPVMVFSGLFAMQSHLFGQIMDIDDDTLAGRRSTAIVLGVRGAKGLLAFMMGIETLIAALYFRGDVVAKFMAAGTLLFVADAWGGPNRYSVSLMKAFFLGWNIIVVSTMHFVWKYGWFLLAE